jgi:hypothetical protein
MILAKFVRFLHGVRSLQRVNLSVSRGAAMRAAREVDFRMPSTWEFAGFSQNGEDGIIEVILRHLSDENRYFVEIGAADGLENNTTWLALVRRYAGLWIEGNEDASRRCREVFAALNYGVSSQTLFATIDSAPAVIEMSRQDEPDLFSMDIDGNDFHVTAELLRLGFRPKVCVVEYNSAFGPELSVTVPYVPDFRVGQAKGANLLYGCSIQGWRKLFSRYGYSFITVDTNGVNAFFGRSDAFVPGFLDAVIPLEFAENTSHSREYGPGWAEQLSLIDRKSLQDIS